MTGFESYAHRESGVMVVRVQGVYCREDVPAIRRFCADRVRREPVGAMLVDLRDALPLLEESDWNRLAREQARGALIATPVAVVVSPTVRPLAQRHCAQMTARGLLRMTFTDLDLALYWASSRRLLPTVRELLQCAERRSSRRHDAPRAGEC